MPRATALGIHRPGRMSAHYTSLKESEGLAAGAWVVMVAWSTIRRSGSDGMMARFLVTLLRHRCHLWERRLLLGGLTQRQPLSCFCSRWFGFSNCSWDRVGAEQHWVQQYSNCHAISISGSIGDPLGSRASSVSVWSGEGEVHISWHKISVGCSRAG